MSVEKNLYAFAGVDGSGKSTLINNVRNELENEGCDVFVSKANTEEIKDLFGDFVESADDIETLFYFQILHRRQYKIAMSKLASGFVVLADRWDESYDAYHSNYGVLSNKDELRNELNDMAFGNVHPDRTFYVDTPIEVANSRISRRGADFFDRKALNYNKTIANYYDNVASNNESWVRLNGCESPENIALRALEVIRERRGGKYNKR